MPALQDAGTAVQEPAADVRRALGWSLLSTVLARVAGLAVSVVLARLLLPADYGTFAVALVVLTALLSVNELGVSLAVVRWPGDPRRIAGTVNALSLAASATLTVVALAAAPLVAQLLGAPEATGVLRLLSLAALVDGVCAVPAALLARELRQKETALVELGGLLLASSLSLGLALAGSGAYSLAWGQLAGNVLVAALFLARCRPYPGVAVRRELVRPLLAFGLPLAGGSALVVAMLNLDYVVVGRTSGAAVLGTYFVAFTVASLPVTLLSTALRRVTVPAFARARDAGSDVGAAFAATVSLLLVVVLPGCVVVSLHAADLLALVYGDRWTRAAGPLSLLVLFAVVRVLAELAYDLLATLGRSRSVLGVQALWLACLLVALPVGVHAAGLRGVAAAHLLVGVLVVLPAFVVALSRAGVPARPLLAALQRPAAVTAAVLAGHLLAGLLIAPGLPLLAADLVLLLAATALLAGRRLRDALHGRLAGPP